MKHLPFCRLCLFVAVFFLSCYAPEKVCAQTNDSILSVLATQELSDINSVELLVDISEAYLNINIDSSILFAQQGLAIAEKINFSKGIAECRQDLGTAYLTQNEFEKAQMYFKAALEQYLSVSNLKGEAKIFRQLGNLYFHEFRYDSALYYYNVSIVLSRQLHDNKNIGLVTIDIASIYNARGNFPKALDTYESALWLLKMEKEDKDICLCLGNIATVYISIGDFEKARDYNRQCLEISDRINDKLGVLSAIANEGVIYAQMNDNNNALIAFKRQYFLADSLGNIFWKNIALSNIGDTYRSLNMPDSAMRVYQLGLREAESTHDSNVIAAINAGMGDILKKQGKSTEAIKHLIITYNIVKSNDITKSVAEVSQDLSEAYEKLHDYKHAFYYYKEYHAYSDSFRVDSSGKKANLVQYEVERVKTADQMKLAEKDTIINNERTESNSRTLLFLTLLGAFVLSGGVLLYRVNRLKEEIEELKA